MSTPDSPVRCRYPIVLLHGLFGFVERRIGPLRFTYFRGVATYLESVGNRVVSVEVNPLQSISYRARQIQESIESLPELRDSPFHIIAHSMGGLDARYLISRLETGDRVKSLTTLSTPHRGSYLADLLGTLPGISRLIPAIPDLSESSAEQFNRETPDNPGTTYLSVPCWTRFWMCCPAMWILYLILRLRNGLNDGQVSLESAKWGRVLEELEADHFQVIGLRIGLNALQPGHHLDLYGRISRAIAEIE